MSSAKEEKGQAATERLKAAALSAAKGLSRTQAEKAAAAATRNVNAYGQKEEGPSRWQERKEAKRQMYLMSTEKAVKLGERKVPKVNVTSMGAVASQCQKCFQPGHWTYECKNERVYISRPSRSQLLKNPKLRQKVMASYNEDNPDMIKEQEDEQEEEKDKKVEKRRKKSKRKYKSDTESSGSEGSQSESDSRSSASGSDASGSSYSSSSDSEEERRRRKKEKKKKDKGGRRKSKRYSSSSASESSDYESSSGSDSEGDRKKRKSGKHSRRR